MLRTEDMVEKRTYLGMQARMKRRRKLIRPRVPMALPSHPNERWSADFVYDQLADARCIWILNVVDDFSRVCVDQLVDLSIYGSRDGLITRRTQRDTRLTEEVGTRNGP
jgi:putative transposase